MQGKGIWTTTNIRKILSISSRIHFWETPEECFYVIPDSTCNTLVYINERLIITPYNLQLIQAPSTDDRERRNQFGVSTQVKLEDVEFEKCLVFSDEITFQTNGKVNKHNYRIWDEETLQATVDHMRNTPIVNMFWTISKNRLYGPFFFKGNVIVKFYL